MPLCLSIDAPLAESIFGSLDMPANLDPPFESVSIEAFLAESLVSKSYLL
jgi:hypothetical protein